MHKDEASPKLVSRNVASAGRWDAAALRANRASASPRSLLKLHGLRRSIATTGSSGAIEAEEGRQPGRAGAGKESHRQTKGEMMKSDEELLAIITQLDGLLGSVPPEPGKLMGIVGGMQLSDISRIIALCLPPLAATHQASANPFLLEFFQALEEEMDPETGEDLLLN